MRTILQVSDLHRSAVVAMGTAAVLSASVIVITTAALTACGAATQHEASANECPLTPPAQQLLSQLVNSVEAEVDAATSMDAPDELAVMWSFVGTDRSGGSSAHLATMCTGQSTQGETCMLMLGAPPIIPNVDTCFRTGCETSNVALIDVYATQPPHHLADDRVSISYATTPPYPMGTVKFDPNPTTRWRLNFSQSTVRSVTAMLQQHVSIALSTGEKIDLSFAGQTSGIYMMVNDAWMTNTALSFEKLSPASVVTVVMTNASNASRFGTVKVGAKTLATFMQDALVWQGACGSPHVAAANDAGFH